MLIIILDDEGQLVCDFSYTGQNLLTYGDTVDAEVQHYADIYILLSETL